MPTKKGESGENGKGTKSIYYIVYVDSYINDTEILPRGVYITKKSIKRLDDSQEQYVQKFTGKIPDKIVHEIAKTLKIDLHDEDGDNRDSKDILSEMVSVL